MTPDRIAELERLLASLPPMTKAEREFADFLKDRLRQMKAAHEANPIPRKARDDD